MGLPEFKEIALVSLNQRGIAYIPRYGKNWKTQVDGHQETVTLRLKKETKRRVERAAAAARPKLDVLHVAAACLLEAREFASFDIRQRKLAAGVGLKPLPETLPLGPRNP